jgi:hypothetical protein
VVPADTGLTGRVDEKTVAISQPVMVGVTVNTPEVMVMVGVRVTVGGTVIVKVRVGVNVPVTGKVMVGVGVNVTVGVTELVGTGPPGVQVGVGVNVFWEEIARDA